MVRGESEGAMLASPLLEARGISKSFPGVRALADVDLQLRGGQVHALVGENGAGKSTLMKILSGIQQPDAGEILLRGEPVRLPTPLRAQQAGISVIHQEFHLMPHLTVAQNLFIGREPRRLGGLFHDAKALNRQAAEVLDRLGVHIDPTARVGQLTVASQQLLEIARALTFDASVLVMDEPTAALVDTEVEVLFRIIDDFISPSTAVVYISHRMEEIRRIATDVTVLRDGEVVASRPAAQMPVPEIIRLMVGRELGAGMAPRPPRPEAAPVLEVDGLSTPDLLRDVSFTLHEGEILGFAGLMGAGRTETARALIGADDRSGGTVRLRGEEVDIRHPGDAVRLGIGYLSEDRKRYGLLLGQDVTANTVLASVGRHTRAGIHRAGAMRRTAQRWVDALAVRTPSVSEFVRNLSGGNQQKVVIAKWLERDCDVLVFDEPTRGIDVGAKQEIHRLLRSLADEGRSVIMISSELEEVLAMSDRIVVMCNGRITGTLAAADATQEAVMDLATRYDQSHDDTLEGAR